VLANDYVSYKIHNLIVQKHNKSAQSVFAFSLLIRFHTHNDDFAAFYNIN
jgi:hypothetical protein